MKTTETNIIITTLNARYSHSSIALRYLYANLLELKDEAVIKEFIIKDEISDIAEKLLLNSPKIIGIGVYIWNAGEVSELVNILKKVSPGTVIVLGGPEVSHFPLRTDLSKADYIIQGEGEKEFYNLCKRILNNEVSEEKIIAADPADVSELELPYNYYTDHDINNRNIYVEVSRGCPFKCEFCLSSLDKEVRYFDTEKILNEFQILWDRGARKFKFIDRTFNLNLKISNKILDFFLTKEPPYFLHFEVIPDNFPPQLKERIKQFPPASLQLEIGIQTLKQETANNISRNLNFAKIRENILFIANETKAHMHLDLIVGLPGESLDSFGENLDQLLALTNSEIQVGILKKLSGTAISRHDLKYGMIYSDKPPYDILETNLVTFKQMQKMKRFARFWDLVYNSGNFNKTVLLLWKNGKVFEGFYSFSEWIYSQTLSTWQISLERLTELLFRYLTEIKKLDKNKTADIIAEDILRVKQRRLPPFLKEFTELRPENGEDKIPQMHKRQFKRL